MKLNLKEGSTTLEFIAVAGILGALSFGLFYANAGEVKDTQQDAADKFRDDQAYLQENKGAESILAKDIQLDTTEVHLQVGESKSVHAQLVPDNVWNTGLVWSVYKNPTKVNAITSSDTMTLTITGMEKGISEINVRASDGSPVIKRVRVVVGDPVVFSASEEEVEIESTKQTVLQITASPADYSKEKVQITWSAEAGAELATFERNVNKLTVIPKENHTEGVVKVHASCYDVVYEQTTEFDFYVNMIAVYSITYDLNSGNPVDNPTQYTKKTETFTLNNPTRRGYTFTGWTGSNGITPNTVVRIVKGTVGDMEYKANWRANVYTIAYDGNTGSGTTASSSHTYDQPKALTKNGFSKTGHLFLGWNTKVDGTGTSYSDEQIVSNLSDRQGATVALYAQWSAKQTETTFYRNYNASDTTTTKVVYTYGKANQYFTNNGWTRTGYNQLGWSLDRNSKTAEYSTTNMATDSWIDSKYPRVSLYAVWDPIVYSITYNLQGGTNHSSNPSSYTIESNDITLQDPTKSGYSFTGWTGSNGDTLQKGVKIPKGSVGNKNYRANWTPNTYTYNVSYVSSSGKSLGTSTVSGVFGTSTTVSAPAKTGYNTPASQVVDFDSVTAKTITFTYTPINYTISYNLNGGSVSGNPTSYNIESAAITLKNPTKTENTFIGWQENQDSIYEVSRNPGVSSDGTKLTFTNSTSGNAFSSFKMQIWDDCSSLSNYYGQYLTISSVQSKSSKYTHNLSSGTYCISMGTNGSKRDYRINFSVYLENGRTYNLEASLASYSDQKIIVDNIHFYREGGYVVGLPVDTIPAGSQGNRSYTANWRQWVTQYRCRYFGGWEGWNWDSTAYYGSNSITSRTVYRNWGSWSGWQNSAVSGTSERQVNTRWIDTSYWGGWTSWSRTDCSDSDRETKWVDDSYWGGWSGWQDSAVSGSSTREVQTQQVKTADAYTQYNLYYYRYWNTSYQAYYYTYGSGMGGTRYNKSVAESEIRYHGNFDGYNAYVKKSGYWNFSGEVWFVSSTQTIPAKYKTQYRYRDYVSTGHTEYRCRHYYSQGYTQYQYRDLGGWTTSAGDVGQTGTQYNHRTPGDWTSWSTADCSSGYYDRQTQIVK